MKSDGIGVWSDLLDVGVVPFIASRYKLHSQSTGE